MGYYRGRVAKVGYLWDEFSCVVIAEYERVFGLDITVNDIFGT